MIDKLEFEILVFASALESHKQQVARCRRILNRAEQDYQESVAIRDNMERQLAEMRNQYLARAA